MKLFFRAFVLIASLVLSGVACAVGMGGINVSSALGDPLNAEIELAGISSKANIGGNLTARMASPDAFKVAGLDYPGTLPNLKFEIETHPDGEPYLRITSQSPVNDPFVTLLVELNWSSGRLLREYTFLLDPPGFKPEQPVEAKVQPMEPIAAAKTSELSTEPVEIEPAPAPANEKAPAMPAATSGRKSVSAGRTSSGNIRVKHGDTLSKIARQVKASDISLERMLVALYRANADEFDGNNMNRLRVGKILRMPGSADIEKMTQAEALEEIRVQAADWNAYRQKLAAASTTAKEPTARQEVSGKISAKVAEKTPSTNESAKDIVKLSQGMAPGEKAVSGSSLTAMQDKINGLQEELIARDKILKDSNNRIEMLEKNIKGMLHLLNLQSQTMASSKQAETKPALPAPNVEAKPEAPAVSPVVTMAPLSAVSEAQQAKHEAKPKPTTVHQVVPAPSSWLDQILNEPLYLAGTAAILLLLLGGGFMVVRRSSRTSSQSRGTVEHNIAEPVAAPEAEVGEATQPSPINAPSLDEEVDPISEADLFMNFGRDSQAEEILKYALEKDPNNQRILLKLLSIYLDRKDPKTFNAIAQRVRASGDPAAWAQAAEMGRKLEPDNPEYSGEAGSGEVAKDIAREPVRHEPGAMGLDFDLDFEKEIAGTGANAIFELDKSAATESSALDFDLGADITEAGSEARAGIDDWTDKFSAGGDQAAHVETEHDFVDITSKSFPLQGADVVQPGAGEETAPAPEGFVDITSKSFPLQGIDVGMPYTGSESAPVADHFVDITSGAGVDSDKSNISGTGVPEQIDSLSFHGIDLNLNQPAAGISVAGGKNAHWNEVAVKIDLARAYQEIGDVVGAHEILKEVMDQGDDQQRAAAMAMLENMSA